MAIISGSATGSNADRVNVWIEWWEDGINYSANCSDVHARFYTQIKADKSSDTRDSSGKSNFYINGTRASGITGIDFRDHNLNTLGTWDGKVYRDSNGNASITFSGNFSLSSSYISGGSVSGTVALTTIWTGAGAPYGLSLSPGIFEDSVTLSWNAGTAGVNNAVTGYRIYYRKDGGTEQRVDIGKTTSYPLNTTEWARGTKVDFRLMAVTQKGDNPMSGFSGTAYKNSAPNAPTNVSVTKTCYAPGEAIRITFSNAGDADGNLKGFEAAKMDSDTVLGDNYASTATHVEVSTATGTWTPGVSYQLSVRARDTLGALSAWVTAPPVMVGLPMFVQPTPGGGFKRVVQMKVYVPDAGFKTVKSMRIAAAQGAINKTIF